MMNENYPDHLEQETPRIPREIIDYLERILPPRDYNGTETMEEIMFYSGKRSVVNLLKSLND